MASKPLLLGRYEMHNQSISTNQRTRVEFALDAKTHDPVVLKITTDQENHEREKKFLQTANTEFVFAMNDAFEMPPERAKPRSFCLVLEAGDEDLQHYFDRRHKRIGRSECCFIAHSAARAIQYLHSQGLVHTDIKPNNLVRGFDGYWRLIDFEMLVHEGETTRGLTIGYLAPEAARAHPQGIAADKSLDIWSLGGLLYELYTGRTFLGNLASPEAIMSFLRGPAEVALGPLVPEEARDLLTQMLSKDPESRPSIEQVLLHPLVGRPPARFSVRDRLATTLHEPLPAPEVHQQVTVTAASSASSPLASPAGRPGLPSGAPSLCFSRTSTQATEQSVEELMAERASLSARLSSLSKDKARLIEEKQQSESKSSWIAQEAEVLRRKSQQLEESFMRLKKQQQDLDAKLFSYQKENIGLKTMRGEMERAMKAMEAENAMLHAENDRLAAELDAVRRELDSHRTAITHAMSALYDGSVRGGTTLREAREAMHREAAREREAAEAAAAAAAAATAAAAAPQPRSSRGSSLGALLRAEGVVASGSGSGASQSGPVGGAGDSMRRSGSQAGLADAGPVRTAGGRAGNSPAAYGPSPLAAAASKRQQESPSAYGPSPLAAAAQKRGQQQESPSAYGPSPLSQAAASRRGSNQSSPSSYAASPLAVATAATGASNGPPPAGLARRLSPSSYAVSPLQAAISAAKAEAQGDRSGASLRRSASQKGLLMVEVRPEAAISGASPRGSLRPAASSSALSALVEEDGGSSRRSTRRLAGGGDGSPASPGPLNGPVGGPGGSERGTNSRRFQF